MNLNALKWIAFFDQISDSNFSIIMSHKYIAVTKSKVPWRRGVK